MLRLDRCLCPDIPRVETRTRFIIIRHQLEAWKATNTARIAALALVSSELYDYGQGVTLPAGALTTPGTWLLYPEGPPSVPEHPPERIVVLDGSWSQARRMMHRIPHCAALPRLSLPAPAARLPTLRRPPAAHKMSTLNAITQVVAMFEGTDAARPLEEIHALLVTRFR
jgi:DTW domain-containing protein YfiP